MITSLFSPPGSESVIMNGYSKAEYVMPLQSGTIEARKASSGATGADLGVAPHHTVRLSAMTMKLLRN